MAGGTVGGTGATDPNTLANNDQNGILLDSSSSTVRVARNSIFDNGVLGIDLAPAGVTINDPGDTDSGANNLQNFPSISSASSGGGTTHIEGSLNSSVATTFTIEFFDNAACDASGNGEGKTFIGSGTASTDGSGNASFAFDFATVVPTGDAIAATATDPNGNTSEFSECRTVENASEFSVSDVSVPEGDGGPTLATFTVTRSGVTSMTSMVTYMTADNTAMTTDNDYQTSSGTLTFAPGDTSHTVDVTVNGDTKLEPNETFFVNLSNPQNATVDDSQGEGTVLNDDPQPAISITDVAEYEGNVGGTIFTFAVTLTNPSYQSISVVYSTADNTAMTTDNDYQSKSGTVTFAAGQTSQPVSVTVNGDTNIESDEEFFVNLSNAQNASIVDPQGKGLIRNDDGSPNATCTIRGTNNNDVIMGTPGDDVICGGNGNDTIDGKGGHDIILGQNGDDLLLGGDGNDLLLGGNGNDTLRGGTENDTLRGENGDDTLEGDAGSDALDGAGGKTRSGPRTAWTGMISRTVGKE